MRTINLTSCFLLAIFLSYASLVGAADDTLLSGDAGASSRWGSGWIDLDTVTDFYKGDRLELEVGGSAKKVFVRLLPRGESADERVGTIGGVVEIPANRRIALTLPEDHRGVIQISVHGGASPWNRALGRDNGPATLVGARLLRAVENAQ